MDASDFVPLVFLAFLAAIIIIPQVLRARDRTRMYDLLRVAYEKGQPVPPGLIDILTRRRGDLKPDATNTDYEGLAAAPSGVDRDLRRGVVWLAVGLGLVGVGLAFYAGLYADGGAAETFGVFAAMGSIPACIGLAYMGLWACSRRKAIR